MSLWTKQQHEWLQALGHPVLLLPGDPDLAEPVPPATEPGIGAAPARPLDRIVREDAPRAAPSGDPSASPLERDDADERTAAARPLRQAPVANPIGVAPSAIAAEVPRPHTDAAAKKAALDEARRAGRQAQPPAPVLSRADPLLAAILRVAGRRTDETARTLAMLDIDLDRLRAEPLAKRALWVRLRTLRRGRDA